MSDPAPILYGFRFPHHGVYSSYARLLDFLPEAQIVRVEDGLPRRLFELSFRKVRTSFWLHEWRLRAAAQDQPEAVVHYLYAETCVQQGWLARRGRQVLTLHQPPGELEATRARRAPLFAAAHAADALVVLDATQQADYARLFGHERVVAIAHGIDTDRFAPAGLDAAPGDRLEVVTVGSWLRDWQAWSEVFHATVARHPAIRFTVLSRPEMIAKLRTATGDHPQFRGLSGLTDDELLRLYQASDVLFLPVTGATANNALLEAASCGLAVVASDLPALRQYLAGVDGNHWLTPGGGGGGRRSLRNLRPRPWAPPGRGHSQSRAYASGIRLARHRPSPPPALPGGRPSPSPDLIVAPHFSPRMLLYSLS